jgi:hypothetical protein
MRPEGTWRFTLRKYLSFPRRPRTMLCHGRQNASGLPLAAGSQEHPPPVGYRKEGDEGTGLVYAR